jgi:uroporphyrinogen-III decarboxylase
MEEMSMATLTPKENYLRALRHEETEYIPCRILDCSSIGFTDDFEKGPRGGGYDGFGVKWITPLSGGGASIPDNSAFLLEDAREWKKRVTIPDLDAIDWAAKAEKDFAALKIDRNQIAFCYGCGNGPYERLGALMGFENALIAMVEEPEATMELLEAITAYKIKLAEKVAIHYKADAFMNFDDIATEQNIFMSPETYRSLIKPQHKRLNNAIINLGMIPIQHTCGKADLLIEDYIETDAAAWSSVQPTNDIKAVLDKYGSKISLEGGYNSNGAPGMRDASPEVIEQEVIRCYKEYGGKRGFIFSGFITVDSLDPAVTMKITEPMREAVRKIRAGQIQI